MNWKLTTCLAGTPALAALIGCTVPSDDTVAAASADQDPPKLDVPYVPTPMPVVHEMIKIAGVTKDDVVYDLGCGDGRIVVTAAKMHGARGIGVDIDPQRIKESNENAKKEGVTDLVKFETRDLFEMKFDDASVMLIYLLPSINVRLRPRLLDELKPGTRIVSHDFDMGDWEPDKTVKVNADRTHTLFHWVIPAKVGGVWTWSEGGDTYTLNMTQKYQKIPSATIDSGSAGINVTNPVVAGDKLAFTVTNAGTTKNYEGRVNGDTVTGTVSTNGQSSAWTARKTR